jgi:hypothetical protein
VNVWPEVAAALDAARPPVPLDVRRVSERVWKVSLPRGRALAVKLAVPGAALDVEAQALAWLTRCGCAVPALLATSGTRPLRWIALEWCGDRTLADVVVAPKAPAGLGTRLAATCARVEAAFARLAGPNGGVPDGAAGELRRQSAAWVAAAPAALEWLMGPHPAGLGDVVLDMLDAALACAVDAAPTLGSLDYNPRNVVVARGRLFLVDFAAVGADWPERRFVQYGTGTGAGLPGGTFATVIGPAALRRFAAETCLPRGRTETAVRHAADAHDVLLLLTAAAELRLVAAGTAHPERIAAWGNVADRRQRLLELLLRRLSPDGPAERFRQGLRFLLA